MTNSARPSARASAAALRVVAFFCAAVTVILSLAACPSRDKKGADAVRAMAPVFPLNGSLREASSDAPALFAIPESTRQRAAARTRDGFVSWDSRSKEVRWLDERGSARARVRLDAAFAWVTDEAILARGAAFADGKGFTFTLYRIRGTRLVKRWTRELDCFPSDALVISPYRVVLAGGDRANERNSIWVFSGTGDPACVLSVPKNDGFLRLIACGDSLVAFSSGREKKRTTIAIHELPREALSGQTATAHPVAGLPGDSLCAFGYGFAFAGDAVVPIARDDGSISLIRLEKGGESYRVVSIAQDSGGCVLPLGEWPAGTYRYLANDPLADAPSFFLGSYDGARCRLTPLH